MIQRLGEKKISTLKVKTSLGVETKLNSNVGM